MYNIITLSIYVSITVPYATCIANFLNINSWQLYFLFLEVGNHVLLFSCLIAESVPFLKIAILKVFVIQLSKR